MSKLIAILMVMILIPAALFLIGGYMMIGLQIADKMTSPVLSLAFWLMWFASPILVIPTIIGIIVSNMED